MQSTILTSRTVSTYPFKTLFHFLMCLWYERNKEETTDFTCMNILCLDTTSIEAIEAKIRNISGEGGLGLDMEALREEFAMRTPPDNTILRIEKIEAELNIDNGAGLEAGMSFKSTGGNN